MRGSRRCHAVVLGDNSTTNSASGRDVPQQTDTSSTGILIRPGVLMVGGQTHTCAILDTGRMQCWGEGGSGELGNGGTNDYPRPRLVGDSSDQAHLGDADPDGDDHHELFEDYPGNTARSVECAAGTFGLHACQTTRLASYAVPGSAFPDFCATGDSTEATGSGSSADCLADTDGDLALGR